MAHVAIFELHFFAFPHPIRFLVDSALHLMGKLKAYESRHG
jgi:hypothetical protein